MVYRIFTEKKEGLDSVAKKLQRELNCALGFKITALRDIACYDIEGLREEQFKNAATAVLSDPATETVFAELKANGKFFAYTALPGQYDQRARQTQECLQFVYKTENLPLVRPSRFLAIEGITDAELKEIKEYLINPLENLEIPLSNPKTIKFEAAVPPPVETVKGFLKLSPEELDTFRTTNGFAMTAEDMAFIQDYFKSEKREPTITEIKVLDTYWSDHCRHSTFFTELTEITVQSENPHIQKALDGYKALFSKHYKNRPEKYFCLMDIAVIAAREIKAKGLLGDLEESEEVNACSVKVDAVVDGKKEKWIVMFKNETHNHPTEIEPFGGASTCLGGGIRDPLSGRVWVYQAMGITGASPDVLKPVKEKLPNKLSQRFLTTTAANGYASYANQIGTNNGLLCEIYHPGYAAKRMEAGFIIGAAPEKNIVRKSSAPGDAVIYVGADTGRDGCGAATGSSREQTEAALDTLSAEVQKGNPVIERKYMRLFRNPEATALIKKCNDFGAGGVSVAIGELADGLDINLDLVPVKYAGLDGSELALSESQERMACIVAAKDAAKFIALANAENVNAVQVATVTDTNRMIIKWRGQTVVDISRDFLNTSGVRQKAKAVITEKPTKFFETLSAESKPHIEKGDYKAAALAELGRLAVTSQKGCAEMFDGTVGAGNVYLPAGGKKQLTPALSMAHKLPVLEGETDTTTVAAYGYNPYLSESDAFTGAVYSVVVSLAKLAASGVRTANARLTLQEYFKRLGSDPLRWGQPLAALLGALTAETALDIPAIGGKDSMSGTFKDIDVPPTVLSFAVGIENASKLITNVLKAEHKNIYELPLKKDKYGMPDFEALKEMFEAVYQNIQSGNIRFATVVDEGGVAAALIKSALGNGVGIKFTESGKELFLPALGNLLVECVDEAPLKKFGAKLTVTVEGKDIVFGRQTISMAEAEEAYGATLEKIFPSKIETIGKAETLSCAEKPAAQKSRITVAKPRVLLPLINGMNGEYDLAKKFREAGAETHELIIKNRSLADIEESIRELAREIKNSQIVALPGGFSWGGQPDGNGKFGMAAFASPAVVETLFDLLNRRDGLMIGIQSGFQALIKLGIMSPSPTDKIGLGFPALTDNLIGRHTSAVCSVRVSSVKSPWMAGCKVGEVYEVPVSFAEGRFIAGEKELAELVKNGQIATQYCKDGAATMEYPHNPSGSYLAVEALTSANGRVLGRMGSPERTGKNLYKNFDGNFDMKIFESGVKYFK